MRILVVNCNTSAAITEEIAVIARAVASPGTAIVATQPSWGVESAEGFYESFITAAAVLDVLAAGPQRGQDPVQALRRAEPLADPVERSPEHQARDEAGRHACAEDGDRRRDRHAAL